MSIGRRLSLLVLSELFTAIVVLVTAIVSLGRLSDERSFMHDYVFEPLVDIGDAFDTVVELAGTAKQQPISTVEARREVGRLRAFIERYQREWQVGGSTRPQAERFRAMLEEDKRLPLIEDERAAVDAFLVPLQRMEHAVELGDEQASRQERGDMRDLLTALIQLNRANLSYMAVGYDHYLSKVRIITMILVGVGLAGIVAAPLFGLSVRRAIAPRISRLVEKIKRFREFGVREPMDEGGGDELTMLARALDVSFAAIAARDEERERFLAVAAHELKTPLTTVKGFAQAALAHRDDAALRDRALAVIDRQATRLGRLVQDLLWSALAHGGKLEFQPSPLDLATIVRSTIASVQVMTNGSRFPFEVRGDSHILGDAWLIEQSLSSLLVQAVTIVPEEQPVPVTLSSDCTSVRVTVEARGVGTLPDDLDDLAEPFAILHYEGRRRDALRSTGLGLDLAREIARLHTGHLRIERPTQGIVVFTLEFRR